MQAAFLTQAWRSSGRVLRDLARQLSRVVAPLGLWLAVCTAIAEPVHGPEGAGRMSYRYEPFGSCGAVLDQQTHLMWQRCSLGQQWNGSACVGGPLRLAWDSAVNVHDEHCGFSDWHLPQLVDLEGLVAEGGIPAIDPLVFPDTPPGSFWTASVSTANARQAWYVNFGKGTAEHNFKDTKFHVRLVRQAQ